MMRKKLFVGRWWSALAAGAMGIVFSVTLAQGQSLADRPNLAGIDFLGRALLYSTNYERYLGRVGLGVGVGSWRSSTETILIVPLYVSFRPIGETNSLYLSAGTTVGSKVSVLYMPTAVRGTVAAGYEHVSKSGLVLRPTVSVFFSTREIFPWPGLMIGYRF